MNVRHICREAKTMKLIKTTAIQEHGHGGLRTIIPAVFRDALNLKKNDHLIWELNPDGTVTLKKQPKIPHHERKQIE